MPGHPTIIKGTSKSGASTVDGGVYSFELHKFGNIDNTDGDTTFEGMCPQTGPIFNPLAEFVWWDQVLNPFADPSRGTIADATIVEADKDDDGTYTWTQPKFMQNLDGKNSIIGKSIKMNLAQMDQGGTDAVACCVIGEDEPPQLAPTAPAYTHPHHHRQGGYK